MNISKPRNYWKEFNAMLLSKYLLAFFAAMVAIIAHSKAVDFGVFGFMLLSKSHFAFLVAVVMTSYSGFIVTQRLFQTRRKRKLMNFAQLIDLAIVAGCTIVWIALIFKAA